MRNTGTDPRAELRKIKDLEYRIGKAREKTERVISRREMDLRKASERMDAEIKKQQGWINQTRRAISSTQTKMQQCQQQLASYQSQLASAQSEVSSAKSEAASAGKSGDGKAQGAAQSRQASAEQKVSRLQKQIETTNKEINKLTGQINELNINMGKLEGQFVMSKQKQSALQQTCSEYQETANRIKNNLRTRVPAALNFLREREQALQEFERTGNALGSISHSAQRNWQSRGSGDSYIDGRRHISEGAAQESAGPGAIILDDHAEHQRGKNFEGLDIASKDVLASVKTHYHLDGSLDNVALRRYMADFQKMVVMDKATLRRQAENIRRLQEIGVPVPERLGSATIDEIEGFLRKETVMMVPDDHVRPVIGMLVQDSNDFPENYRLPPTSPEIRSTYFSKRVKGFGLTAAQIEDLIHKKLQN